MDTYTIQRELGRLDNIKVGLVGDLANGRTARSLAYMLSKFDNIKIYFVAPDVVKMGVRHWLCMCPFCFRVELQDGDL